MTPAPVQMQKLVKSELKYNLDGNQKRVQEDESHPAKKPYQEPREADKLTEGLRSIQSIAHEASDRSLKPEIMRQALETNGLAGTQLRR